MQLFYVSGFEGSTCVLGEEESWHCIKVLRLHEGAQINLTDGLGNLYQGYLTKIIHMGCHIGITHVTPHNRRSNWSLHVAMAPTKNIERFEWFLEKATEIGIDEITPLICEHSERKTVKLERLQKVMVSAMKQSNKLWLPRLNEPVNFRDFISRAYIGQKFIAWCETGNESELHNIYQKDADVLILVGPEGDYSKSEIELAVKSGFVPVSLGESRLRTETAGIVACHTIEMINKMVKCPVIIN